MTVSLSPAPATFPGEASEFALAGPAGRIEVAADVPAADARAGVAVICHPHPVHGGSMRNKVVTMLERALRECGLAAVRFNFRGVGASDGAYDEGRGEGEDLAAVAAWVRAVRPGDALWLGGFSFGSYVALANARRLGVDALITVAPPVGRWPFDAIALPDCPWLVVQGEDDELVDPQAVFAWTAQLASPPTLVRMPETGHFFHRRLIDLRGAVKNGVRAWLPPLRDA
ncbi:MAG: alpha/beta family hydrolase [Mizugakiibacter sp.]|uniref:alpha/beta hydrolase n=1 Tax=Mizugakiibacter sp. TaxID=1972610 RepID=UPI0031BCA31F|nr:alpha/beta hydrolase [Xanthomonadaceae bacterium]